MDGAAEAAVANPATSPPPATSAAASTTLSLFLFTHGELPFRRTAWGIERTPGDRGAASGSVGMRLPTYGKRFPNRRSSEAQPRNPAKDTPFEERRLSRSEGARELQSGAETFIAFRYDRVVRTALCGRRCAGGVSPSGTARL
ncbi:hypothetical protein GCM10020001_005990 [Nonomuraea salmonea]